MNRSTYAFCQGERAAMTTCSSPRRATRWKICRGLDAAQDRRASHWFTRTTISRTGPRLPAWSRTRTATTVSPAGKAHALAMGMQN